LAKNFLGEEEREGTGRQTRGHYVHMSFISLGNQAKNNSQKRWAIAFYSTTLSRQEERKELADCKLYFKV